MPAGSDPDAQGLAVDGNGAAEPLDRERARRARRGRADRCRRRRAPRPRSPATASAHGRSPVQVTCESSPKRNAATASAVRARLTVSASVSTIAPVPSTAIRSSPEARCELERVRVDEQRVVPPGLDPRCEPELVEQEHHLRRRPRRSSRRSARRARAAPRRGSASSRSRRSWRAAFAGRGRRARPGPRSDPPGPGSRPSRSREARCASEANPVLGAGAKPA